MSAPRPSRRTVFRGVGATVALPWLEAVPLTARGADPGAHQHPRWFAALFVGNRVSPKNWGAKSARMEVNKSLEPLKPFRTHLNVMSGLFNKSATDAGIHPGETGNILSGAAHQKGAVLRGGVNVDAAGRSSRSAAWAGRSQPAACWTTPRSPRTGGSWAGSTSECSTAWV